MTKKRPTRGRNVEQKRGNEDGFRRESWEANWRKDILKKEG